MSNLDNLSRSLPIPPPSTPPPNPRIFKNGVTINLANQLSGSSNSPRKKQSNAVISKEVVNSELLLVKQQHDQWRETGSGRKSGRPNNSNHGMGAFTKPPVQEESQFLFRRPIDRPTECDEGNSGGNDHEDDGITINPACDSNNNSNIHPQLKHAQKTKFRSVNSLDAWPGRGDHFKPKLLKKLERYVNDELRELDQLHCAPNATRIKVFRQAFQKFISEFKSYSVFLEMVKNEYDSLLSIYASKLHAIPTMQAEILSLRKGANQNIENLQMMFSKEKSELKEELRGQVFNQRVLENKYAMLEAKLMEQNKSLNEHKDKYEDLKGSTVTLTNALVRLEDDNSIRGEGRSY